MTLNIQTISRRIAAERLELMHVHQHTIETTRDVHALARESDKVVGWLTSSISASLLALSDLIVSVSLNASRNAYANNDAQIHDAQIHDAIDSQHCQQRFRLFKDGHLPQETGKET